MATLTYDNISLPFVYITHFEQTAIYDELGDTDWYVTRFDISAQTVINTNYFTLSIGGGLPLSNPADIMTVIRSMLLKPRKQLSVTFNGVELIPKPQAGLNGTVDAKNGPKPQACTIIQLTNTTFLVVYRIIAHYWENNKIRGISPAVSNQRGGTILYNRWTESADIDQNNFSTRTRDGQFVIRSDNASGFVADQVRAQMAIVGIPPGFLRESAHYQVTPDGLMLKYRVVDKQVFKKPPAPAFRADGHFTRTNRTSTDPKWRGDCYVRLEGDPTTSQAALMSVAIEVAYSKLLNLGFSKSGMLTQCELKAGLYSNWVEARIGGWWNKSNQGVEIKTKGTLGSILTGIAAIPLFLGLNRIGNATDASGTAAAVNARPFVQDTWSYTPISDDPGGPFYVPPYQLRGNLVAINPSPGGVSLGLLLQAAAYYDPSILNATLRTSTIFPPDNRTYPNGTNTNLPGTQPGAAGLRPEA